MITSKERAQLRRMGNALPSLLRVGKNGITAEIVAAVDEALEARELIKIELLQNCPEEIWAAADTISGRTRSDIAQVIGKKILLYRKSKTSPRNINRFVKDLPL